MSDRDPDEKEPKGTEEPKEPKPSAEGSVEPKAAEESKAAKEPKKASSDAKGSKAAGKAASKATSSKDAGPAKGTNAASDPDEARARNISIAMLGLMTLLWIVFGALSFTPDRHRPDTANFVFRGQDGYRGKQVFQAYSCMDCHTIVGNGAYFAPDLTFIYRDVGPAYLEAFIGSAGSWPTKTAVDILINRQRQAGELNVASVDDYYARYPRALERVTERGGRSTIMPNLHFRDNEIPALIAFFAYTSEINTQEWPPEIRATDAAIRRFHASQGRRVGASGGGASSASAAAAAPTDPVERGRLAASEIGCMACHSTDGSTVVGPSWKGLFNSSVDLEGGSTVTADADYLRSSIVDARAQIVRGFAPTMPPYQGMLSDEQVNDIVAFIQSLE